MADLNHAKGRLAEVKALAHFAEWGCEVAPVLGDNTSCDLIVLKDGVPFRVEVKSAQAPTSAKRTNPSVSLGSHTHRRADGGLPNKPVDLSRFDLLAVYVAAVDKVYVWWSRSIEVKKTFTLTEYNRALSLGSGEDLVDGPSTAEGRLGFVRFRRDTETVPPSLKPTTQLTPALDI